MTAYDMAESMRIGMRRLASGVCVLTSIEPKSETRYAMTASSVTSLSAEPASLLVCVNTSNHIVAAIDASQRFCINVLATQHQGLAELCADRQRIDERFNRSDWSTDGKLGLPFLPDAEAMFFCELDQTITYSTHNIYIGLIREVAVQAEDYNPLIYFDGAYQRLW